MIGKDTESIDLFPKQGPFLNGMDADPPESWQDRIITVTEAGQCSSN